MTNHLKKTSAQKQIDENADNELKSGSKVDQVLSQVNGVSDLLKYTAERFNSMREQLSMCCSLLKNQKSDAYKYVIMSKALAQGDYGLLLDEERKLPPTYDVEDATEFTKLLQSIEDTKRYDTRMTLCLEVHRKIHEAIERWNSKIIKMRPVSSASGATKAEICTAGKKITQFKKAIAILKRRDSLVCRVYYNAKKQITDFIETTNDEFYEYMTTGDDVK